MHCELLNALLERKLEVNESLWLLLDFNANVQKGLTDL